MRRVFVVGVLLAMMLGLSALQADGDGEGDPLTLATIGFVVLAAFALAELGGALGLPKVTGYILAGVTLGPFAGNILSETVVGEIGMFNTLALGLIATTAGLELDLGGLRRLAKTLGATIALKIVFGVVLVGGALYTLEASTGLLGLRNDAERVSIALVLAALSLGTSPSIALAIISESKAKGRIADLVLGAAIVKDVVVVVCLAVAVATAKALTGGGSLGADVLVHVAKELGASILAGSILGGLLILYMRFIKAEMLLFVGAMVLIVAEVSVALHLELLMVFIVAGMVVRNVSTHEHDLLDPLETVSLPVFIVFFTNAGASVNLGEAFSVLPAALAVCAARAVGYFVAARVGGRIGGEAAPVRRLAWLGYLPQAGVTLGLLGLASTQLVDSIGATVATLGMAVVAVNLLVGPVTMRIALRRAGEIPSGEAADTDDVSAESQQTVHAAAADLEDPGLAAIVSRGIEAARTEVERWMERAARPRIEELRQQAVSGLRELKDAARIRKLLVDLREQSRGTEPPGAASLFAALAATCRDLPDERRVPLEAVHRRVQPGDGRWLTWRKRFAAVLAFVTFRGSKRKRKVPVLLVARTRLEPRFVALAADAQAGVQRFVLEVLTTLQDVAGGATTPAEAQRSLEDRAPRVATEIERSAGERIDEAFAELARTLAAVDSFALPVSKVRYSSVEREIREGVRALDVDLDAWREHRDAGFTTAIVVATINAAHRDTAAALETRVTAPLEAAFLAVSEAVTILDRRLSELAEKAAEHEPDRLQAEIHALLPKPAAKALRSALADARKVPSAPEVVEPLLPDLPARAELVGELRTLAAARRPAESRIVDVPIRERAHARIEDALIEELEGILEPAKERLEEADKTLSDAMGLVEFLHRGHAEAEADRDTGLKALLAGMEQARARIHPLRAESIERSQSIRPAVAGPLDASYGSLVDELLGGGPAATHHGEVLGRTSALGRGRAIVRERLTAAWARLVVAFRGEANRYAEVRRRRSEATRFDPGDMREFLAERKRLLGQRSGPSVYDQLFADEAVRDPVLFVANREELDALVQAERTWDNDKAAGNAALVVGGSGSGKTSVLAVGRVKIGLRRSVVVGRRSPGTKDPLLATLAARLDCEPGSETIAAALVGDRTLMSIDDLHTWVDGSARGISELQVLLRLIEHTAGEAFWVLSIDRAAFRVLADVMPMRGWFAQVLELQAANAETLHEVIAARHRPTGAALDYPDEGLAMTLARLRQQSADERYASTLGRRAGGSLRRALQLWVAHAVAVSSNRVRMNPITAHGIGLPFWPSFDLDALALLALLARGGPYTAAQLAEQLSTDPTRAIRLVQTAGLCVATEGEYELVPEVRDDVEAALRSAGLLGEEAS